MARIRAILRRASNRAGKSPVPDELAVGPIMLNTGTHQVHVAGNAFRQTAAQDVRSVAYALR